VFAALVVLPFALPLGGPETLDPAALADDNGLFVTVEGETLYAVHAAADGPAVVLVHGFGGSTVTWTETLPALAAAGYDAYALDLRIITLPRRRGAFWRGWTRPVWSGRPSSGTRWAATWPPMPRWRHLSG